MRTKGLRGVVVFIVAGVVGCAQLKNVFLPPPPQIPPAKKEAILPSPSTPAPPPAAPAAPAAPAPVTVPAPTRPPATPPAAKAPAPVPPATAPAPVPPTTKEQVPPPPSPPAVLSPQVGQADEDRLKRESSVRIQKAEELIKQIDQKKLKKDQQDTFSTIQSFLINAKEAMTAQDFLRAFNLADKAQILAEELFRAIQ